MDQVKVNADLAGFMVDGGACSPEIAAQIAKEAKQAWKPLGMLLVEEELLTLKGISKVLSYQADHPKTLFGDAAVTLGLCTADQIDEALESQVRTCPHVLDLALQSDQVDQNLLMQSIRKYIRFAERRLARLDDAVMD